MTRPSSPLIAQEPVLVFGGSYSNLQATEAVLTAARERQIPFDHVICTGDLAAYCANPQETIERVRRSGIHVVMGNCDEQLADGAGDCGCGFPADSACDRLSAAWFQYCDARVSADQRGWLAQLPRSIELQIGGTRLAVIHGSVSAINHFIFATTDAGAKAHELDLAGCNGVIGGHCGLPFTEIVAGRLWHNPGVVGMPANDGTPRVWYSVLTPLADGGLEIEHAALSYDHENAARAMADAGLPPDYRIGLETGLWPSLDVLPAWERSQTGQHLASGALRWRPKRSTEDGKAEPDRLLWPEHVVATAEAV
ncbi:MAG: metallophosphoesterase family protein [Pseudomonadota bacterium]